jgi:ATP-dependent Lon protease
MQPVPVALPLRDIVIFPGTIRTISVGRASSVAAIEHHLTQGAPLVFVPQLDADEEDPMQANLAKVGCIGQVLRAARLPDGSMRVLVEGVERARLKGKLKIKEGATVHAVESMPTVKEDPLEVAALSRHLGRLFQEFMVGSGLTPQEQDLLMADPNDPARLADQIAGQLELKVEQRIHLLELPGVLSRQRVLLEELSVNLASQRIANEVNDKVQKAMDQSQREYHIKEQMKILREELGDKYGSEAEADEFEKRVRELGLTPEAEKEALREVDRMRRIHPDTAEYTIARTWLETVCELPWKTATTDTTDLGHAQAVLDEDHHGLEKVKERLIEYLAVRQLKPDHKGAILCFVGPPGVGKTSLGRSIARALGRNFGRIALGGIKDETEIRGHRRTYVGALPGRIIRAMARAGSRNPVLVLDEIDKVGADFRGDPASALLEVLDPEQNNAFVDHYLDIAIDLSQVLFICTANLIDPIPHALTDRLEIIEIPGYTEEDKLAIAREYVLPKLGRSHGLTEDQFAISTPALLKTIREYTREAGLRDLERQLATLHRKAARQIVEGRSRKVSITDKSLSRYLGPVKYFQELSERVDQPGVVIGLAWTAAGGDILFVEATRMPGKASLKLTGSLGPVMKESVEAAMSWLRSHASLYEIPPEAFDSEFHLHVPAGAIPKDGPSAGVTMVTALASLVTGRPVRSHLAMTGEITLRGKVLPVGGIKEKVLAARRAGVRTVLLPRHNGNDLEDIPQVLRRDMTFVLVDTVQEVLERALEPRDAIRSP